ncbi:MAG: hypothetical protein IPJ79_01105 [Bacteroidetes bacterium]|nr:hypothetical protein [Bacteroidota bacterium]
MDTSLNYISECGYWNLTKNNGTSNVNVNLCWSAPNCGAFEISSMKVGKWNGTKWTDQGNGGITGNLSNGKIASAASQSAVGYFTWAYKLIPILDFSASTHSPSVGSAVTFTNLSTGFSPFTNFIWFFDDAVGKVNLDSIFTPQMLNDTTIGSTTINHTFTSNRTYHLILYAFDFKNEQQLSQKILSTLDVCQCSSWNL